MKKKKDVGYTAQGRTNLPGQTTVLVQAIRRLQPLTKMADPATKPQPVYAIVAREQVKTDTDGKWQTTLKILQPAGKGASLESWQQNFLPQQLPLQADDSLQFMATTTALPGDLQLEGDVVENGKPTEANPALQINLDGSRFLQASQSLPIQAPATPQQPTIQLQRQVVQVPVQKIAATDAANSATPAAKSDAPLLPDDFVR